MRAESELTAEVVDQSEISWLRPLTLQEAWTAASAVRRRWLLAGAGLFALGVLWWLVWGFIPAHTLPRGEWLVVLGFLPLAGMLALGISLTSLMATAVPHPIDDPVLGFVRDLARQVHGLTKVELDGFASALADVPPTTSKARSSGTTINQVIVDFDAEGVTTGDSLLSALQGSDPEWLPRLRDALVTIIAEERAGIHRTTRAERLAFTGPSARQRARWRPAFLAIAMLIPFAPIIGDIVLGLLGIRTEFALNGGLEIGPWIAVTVGWLGLQVTALPNAPRDGYIKELANALSR